MTTRCTDAFSHPVVVPGTHRHPLSSPVIIQEHSIAEKKTPARGGAGVKAAEPLLSPNWWVLPTGGDDALREIVAASAPAATIPHPTTPRNLSIYKLGNVTMFILCYHLIQYMVPVCR